MRRFPSGKPLLTIIGLKKEVPDAVRNAWYIAAWADEIGGEPLARRICDEPTPRNDRIRRREIILLTGAAALAWPRVGVAQVTATSPHIAIITARAPEAMTRYLDAFTGAVDKLGLVQERDYTIVLKSTGGDPARAAPLLSEMIALNPRWIITTDTPLTLAAKHATKEIPIVGVGFFDPVGFGLVASLGIR